MFHSGSAPARTRMTSIRRDPWPAAHRSVTTRRWSGGSLTGIPVVTTTAIGRGMDGWWCVPHITDLPTRSRPSRKNRPSRSIRSSSPSPSRANRSKDRSNGRRPNRCSDRPPGRSSDPAPVPRSRRARPCPRGPRVQRPAAETVKDTHDVFSGLCCKALSKTGAEAQATEGRSLYLRSRHKPFSNTGAEASGGNEGNPIGLPATNRSQTRALRRVARRDGGPWRNRHKPFSNTGAEATAQ